MLRLEKNLTQAELAERCGLSTEQISKFESGKSWTGELSLTLILRSLEITQDAIFDFNEVNQFLKEGGLRKRIWSKPPKGIVVRNGKVLVPRPKNQKK